LTRLGSVVDVRAYQDIRGTRRKRPMHAVLIEVNVSDVDREAGLRGIREQLVPAISQMPGFRSGTWLTGNDAGIGLSLTVWDTDEHAKAFAGRFGAGAAPQTGVAVTRCELREVAATA
jgi:hypothetical protein